ncbi:MAG: DUF2314 domain-containing protein [Myxococcota bacterium]|jgi:uncharacterized protein YegJ (DUF2314 family)|nr:DUF2314 domain-containing protein [Myxococcota bacterium]
MEAAALDTLQAAHRGDLDDLKTRMHSHAPGELPPIYLKVAFPVHRRGVATEWMWVQVVHWGSETIEGVLVNEPILRTDVRAGQYVAFTRDRVADFQESSGIEARGNALRKMVHGGLYSPSLGGNIPASAEP